MALTRLSVSYALGAFALALVLSMPIKIAWPQDTIRSLPAPTASTSTRATLLSPRRKSANNIPNMPPEQKRDYLINYVTDVVVLSQAAGKQGLADRPDVKRRLDFDHNRLLMELLLQETGKAALSDEAEHKVYDDAVKQMSNEEEVHARHILVPTEDEAKAILAQLKGGADFATLAKEKSKDPGGADGGDLGYFTKEQMVPEFAAVAFKLDKGQLSDPVKTQFGWHIIKVEDKRIKPTPTFEQVKGQLENYVAHRAQAALVEKLRASANIERLDKPAPAPAADPSLNTMAPSKK